VARIGDASGADDGRVRGVGVAFCVESTGMGSGEPARVRVRPDGIAELYVGSTPQGQGHQTMAGQVLAERLGWPLDRVRVVAGDTRHLPGGGLTAGSRSAVHVGNATALVATAAREALLERAAALLEAAPHDLVLADGVVGVRGAPGRALPVTDALDGETLDVTRAWETTTGTAWASGCHAAEVAVDPETGAVEVLRYVIVHDSGREINPLLVEGQLHGGLAHGIGYALYEEVAFSPEGDFLTGTFLDYAVPSAPEIAFEPVLVARESHTDFNPEGVKGVGEAGTIPAPATIAAAVEAALRRVRPEVRVRSVPLTSDRVRTLLAAPRSG
jgi:aerobic carbon-monoxide dehydrogenase large subunit